MTGKVQDFEIVAGDDDAPQFTVYSDAANTTPLNLSGCTEIVWLCTETITGPVVLQYTKTGGAVTLPGGGTDGVIAVAMAKTDTANLAGYYFHKVKITDAQGNKSTVELGTLHVIRNLGNV